MSQLTHCISNLTYILILVDDRRAIMKFELPEANTDHDDVLINKNRETILSKGRFPSKDLITNTTRAGKCLQVVQSMTVT
jgi:hypothetical protein